MVQDKKVMRAGTTIVQKRQNCDDDNWNTGRALPFCFLFFFLVSLLLKESQNNHKAQKPSVISVFCVL